MLKYPNIPYLTINGSKDPCAYYNGEIGMTTRRLVQKDDIPIRIMDYWPDYRAYCRHFKQHMIHLLEGEMINILKDGTQTILTAGIGCVVGEYKEIRNLPIPNPSLNG